MATNTYKLTLYVDSNNTTTLSYNEAKSLTIGSASYNVTWTEMTYNKDVYQHNEILAKLSVAATGGAFPTIEDIKATFLKHKIDLEINDNKIALGYLVFLVRPVYSTSSSATTLKLELSIYSPDKLMDLDNYSRAYTGRRLYTDILANEKSKFDSINVANHMQLLKFKQSSSETKDNSTVTYEWAERDEMRIPYIVQYNETFYKFMVRAANRFGEFLYYENGTLNLGMELLDTNYYERNSDKSIVTDNGKQVVIDWATKPSAVQNRYYESEVSEGISITDCAYSYMDHKKPGDEMYRSEEGKRYNIDPVSNDEWAKQKLHKKFYRTQKEIWEEELQTMTVEFVFKCLGASTLGQFLTDLAVEAGEALYQTLMYGINCNDTMHRANFDPMEEQGRNDQISDDHYNQFATYVESVPLINNLYKFGTDNIIGNFTSLFYPLIRDKEKEIGSQAVWLELGSNYWPFKLGEKLNVAGEDYVVIHVEGSLNSSTETLKLKAIPLLSMGEATKNSTKTGTEDWVNSIPLPPAMPDVIIRDARPQVAFVVSATDPEYLGRIRVRYPWQDSEGDESPWIRVTLPLATSGGAVNFTPEEGDEVMVGYEYGNIDRPYAMGYLTAPFVTSRWENSLPFDHWGEEHGIKVKTGHHLLFTDGPNGASFITNLCGPLAFLKGLYPVGYWPLSTPNLADLAGGFELSDRYGFYKIRGCTDERSVTIESPMGTVEMSAFQGITISAPNGDVNITGKNVTISANNKVNITSGKTIKDRFYYKNDYNNAKTKTYFKSLGMDAVLNLKDKVYDDLFDFSFLRCVMETLLRPVEGTLQIKSYTFVSVEAGEGTVEIPQEDSFAKGQDPFFGRTQTELASFKKNALTISMIKPSIDALINYIHEKYDAVCDAVDAFNKISGKKGINKNGSAISFDTIKTRAIGDNVLQPFADNDLVLDNGEGAQNNLKDEDLIVIEENADSKTKKAQKSTNKDREKRNRERRANRTKIKAVANALRIAIYGLKEAARSISNVRGVTLQLNGNTIQDVDADIVANYIHNLTLIEGRSIKSLNEMINANYDSSISKASNGEWKDQKCGWARYVMYQYVRDHATNLKKGTYTFDNPKDTLDNTKWGKFARSVEGTDLTKDWLYRLGRAQRFFLHEYNPLSSLYSGIWDHTHIWKNGFKGKILMSDTNDRTRLLSGFPRINRESDAQNIVNIRKALKDV